MEVANEGTHLKQGFRTVWSEAVAGYAWSPKGASPCVDPCRRSLPRGDPPVSTNRAPSEAPNSRTWPSAKRLTSRLASLCVLLSKIVPSHITPFSNKSHNLKKILLHTIMLKSNEVRKVIGWQFSNQKVFFKKNVQLFEERMRKWGVFERCKIKKNKH